MNTNKGTAIKLEWDGAIEEEAREMQVMDDVDEMHAAASIPERVTGDAKMETTKTYNGWTNYETWSVGLYMNNDEGSYTYWKEQADGDLDVASLAAMIKEEHEDAIPESLDSIGFATDLLNAAMSEVDWHELASHILEAAEEEPIDIPGFQIQVPASRSPWASAERRP